VVETLRKEGFRVAVDSRSEKIGYKIREAQIRKVPFMLVVGDKEMEAKKVAVRNRREGDEGEASVGAFSQRLLRAIRERSLAE
jgi:threonyl-tRNA synthetase